MTGPFEFEIVPSRDQTGRWFRQRGNIVIVLDNGVPPSRRRATFQSEFGEITPDTCRPGEGPPAAAPDPEGRGLHPLVYRGTTATRSRNPTVGDAQILLNNFLARLDPTFSTCTFAQPGGLERARRLLAELNAAGENPLAVDCRFGPNTERATKLFQLCKGINDDGKIGPVTWPLLEAFRRRVPPPPPPPALRLNPPRWRPILRGVLSPHAALRDGNAVLSMIDGVETFRPMVDAIRRTSGERDYIYLLGWRLIDDFEMIPCDPTTTARRLFADASARGVQIRAMLWDQPGTANSPEVARIDALPTGAAILDNETPNPIAAFGSHHQKVLVVKAGGRLIGFCGGADINSDRIDPCPISSRPERVLRAAVLPAERDRFTTHSAKSWDHQRGICFRPSSGVGITTQITSRRMRVAEPSLEEASQSRYHFCRLLWALLRSVRFVPSSLRARSLP